MISDRNFRIFIFFKIVVFLENKIFLFLLNMKYTYPLRAWEIETHVSVPCKSPAHPGTLTWISIYCHILSDFEFTVPIFTVPQSCISIYCLILSRISIYCPILSRISIYCPMISIYRPTFDSFNLLHHSFWNFQFTVP